MEDRKQYESLEKYFPKRRGNDRPKLTMRQLDKVKILPDQIMLGPARKLKAIASLN